MKRRNSFCSLAFAAAPLLTAVAASMMISLDDHGARAGMQRPAMTLLSQSTYVSGAEGSSFRLSLRLSAPLASVVDTETRIVLTSHRPAASRRDVLDAVAGELPQIIDSVSFPIGSEAGRTESGGAFLESQSRRLDLIVRTEMGVRTPDALQMSATGVYPLTIALQQADETVVGLTSFIERLEPDQFAPSSVSALNLALVGRIGSPVSLSPDLDTSISSSVRSTLSQWVSLFERRPGFPSTLAIQPEMLDAFGRSTPQDQDLLIRLQRAAAFETMSTTYVSMDPTDVDRHGLSDIFTRQLRLGESTLASLFPARISTRQSWLQTQPLSSGGARILADLGFRIVVLPPDSRPEPPERETGADATRLLELDFADGESILGAPVDAAVAAALERGSLRPDGGEHLVAYQILADLKMLRADLDSRAQDTSPHSLILSSTSGDMPTPAMTDALIEAISGDVRFAFADLEDALVHMDAPVEWEDIELESLLDQPADLPANSTLSAIVSSLDSTIEAFASVLPDGDQRARDWRRLVDVVADSRLTFDDRQLYVESVRSRAENIASSVVPPSATTFTLGGRDSPIRFTIRNDGPTDLNVLVRLRSPKLRLPEGDKIVTLLAQSSTAVEFAVNARSNGRFPVTLQLLTPSGDVLLGQPSTLTARVNALAGLGQLVTGVALLFLATWWASHFRKEYRRRQFEASKSSHRHPSADRGS